MKEKIIIFVIGLLAGAVIATGAFYVYSKATTCNTNNNQQIGMPGGNPPSMPNGQNSQNGQPPEKQSGQNSQNGQAPEKPSDNNTQNSNAQNSN